MKAMEKDRGRRYASASEFGSDLNRHLNDEPVIARPPSASYRIAKFVRRHKGAVAAGMAVVSSLAMPSRSAPCRIPCGTSASGIAGRELHRQHQGR